MTLVLRVRVDFLGGVMLRRDSILYQNWLGGYLGDGRHGGVGAFLELEFRESLAKLVYAERSGADALNELV